jgi:hypothetical protein
MNKLILILMLVGSTAWGVTSVNTIQQAKETKQKFRRDMRGTVCYLGAMMATKMLMQNDKEMAKGLPVPEALGAFQMACIGLADTNKNVGYSLYCIEGTRFAVQLLSTQLTTDQSQRLLQTCGVYQEKALKLEKSL